ncbi:MAG TPA: vWA domain-containing protein, partial [Polyangiaceae bacterium]|nr:vWA domain-containing protein [Polyangiaceae bacterium]
MTERGFGLAEGVTSLLGWSLAGLLGLWLVLLLLEGRARRVPLWVTFSGLVTALLVAAAVLRPTRVTTRGSELFPKVVVLLDRSWRLGLKAGEKTREQLELDALHALQKQLKQARVEVLGFGEGAPVPFVENQAGSGERPTDSDLTSALRALSAAPGERPKALVVVSDGRLSSPNEGASAETMRQLGARLGVPIHSIKLAET